MQVLFVHPKFPGPFSHFAAALADLGHEVTALAVRPGTEVRAWKGVRVVPYQVLGQSTPGLHPWLVDIEAKTLRAEACWRAARALQVHGFSPELVVADPAWGEPLFLKQVWPQAKLVVFASMFYQASGTDMGFDPEFASPLAAKDLCWLQMKNLNYLAHLDQADAALSPTQWQANTFPEVWRQRIHVIHDGIDTDALCPRADARFELTTGEVLTRDDEVITYVARHLEPYRGTHVFMRAMPELLRLRPNAHVVILGNDAAGHGAASPAGTTWLQVFTNEVREQIPDADWARVHFVRKLSFADFTSLLQVSRVHVYLSYPLVLSWSLLEAMSVGCCIVASDTTPVREAISSGEQGQLVNFFDQQGLVDRVAELLDNAAERNRLGMQARERAVRRYDLKRICLPRKIHWVNGLVGTSRRCQATGAA